MPENSEDFLDTRAVMRRYHLGEQRARDLMRRLGAFRLGRRRLIVRASRLEAWIREQEALARRHDP